MGKGLQASVRAMIYIGKDSSQRCKVAVKIFDLSEKRSRTLKVFIREIESLSVCNHENVVKMLGVGAY